MITIYLFFFFLKLRQSKSNSGTQINSHAFGGIEINRTWIHRLVNTKKIFFVHMIDHDRNFFTSFCKEKIRKLTDRSIFIEKSSLKRRILIGVKDSNWILFFLIDQVSSLLLSSCWDEFIQRKRRLILIKSRFSFRVWRRFYRPSLCSLVVWLTLPIQMSKRRSKSSYIKIPINIIGLMSSWYFKTNWQISSHICTVDVLSSETYKRRDRKIRRDMYQKWQAENAVYFDARDRSERKTFHSTNVENISHVSFDKQYHYSHFRSCCFVVWRINRQHQGLTLFLDC